MHRLYWKLAKTNLKSNGNLYVPYILSGVITVAMFYVMMFIANNSGLNRLPSPETLTIIMKMGSGVLGFFSYVFLFYANSFIRKNRKKEIGVYNILGMEKSHIGRIIGLENIVVAFSSIIGGVIVGVLFSKLSMMFLYRLLGFQESIRFEISGTGIKWAFIVFGILYALIYCYNRIQIKLSNPMELLRGSHTGEKEPKSKYFMALVGVVCLAVGYYISITTKQPLKALQLFFIAVILVIIGTYLLFISGSIVLLKFLRKNKKFYYNRKHFVAVSGMLYRMKQNAAGLASICILSTMVLVVLSTTVSLFAGVDDELNTRYDREMSVHVESNQAVDYSDEIEPILLRSVKEQGRTATNQVSYGALSMPMKKTAAGFTAVETYELNKFFSYVNIMTARDFMKKVPEYKGKLPNLKKGEVAVYSSIPYTKKQISVYGQSFSVVQQKKYVCDNDAYMMSMLDGDYYILVDSLDTIQQIMNYQKSKNVLFENRVETDLNGSKAQKIACAKAVKKQVSATLKKQKDIQYMTVESRSESEDDFYSVYGGILFLGILLGGMFLMVTVMIIFYKQISEGYDDRERYVIMEKVGMSGKEVKESIRTQILLVFFIPIVTAVIHVMVAFPLIWRLLILFNLQNKSIFVKCLCCTISIFILIYALVFRRTSNVYYKIVGN